MSPVKFPEEKYFAPPERIIQHAALSAAEGVASGLPGLEMWEKASLKRTPVKIYDINGKLLFLDYPVAKGAELIGSVRTAASKVLGQPVLAREAGARNWNYDAAVKKLTPRVKKEYSQWAIADTKLVCYSYPKLGVMYSLKNSKGKTRRLIFDVADFSLIREGLPREGNEGAYAWSYYDSLSDNEREKRLRIYVQADKSHAKLSDKMLALVKQDNIGKVSASIGTYLKLGVTKKLQFCTHYAYDEARSHHCFVLHAQQVNDYCAVATCQMILCYYRYYYTQNQIAPSLGYSAGSGCPADQSAGYESLSNNHIDAAFDTSPTWLEARNQIDALHPLKSGISGHARACAGYSSVVLIGLTQKSLYIYDPWPWNSDYKLGGAITWENWDSITHTNYVTTRLQY
jgi:hypothetical protein